MTIEWDKYRASVCNKEKNEYTNKNYSDQSLRLESTKAKKAINILDVNFKVLASQYPDLSKLLIEFSTKLITPDDFVNRLKNSVLQKEQTYLTKKSQTNKANVVRILIRQLSAIQKIKNQADNQNESINLQNKKKTLNYQKIGDMFSSLNRIFLINDNDFVPGINQCDKEVSEIDLLNKFDSYFNYQDPIINLIILRPLAEELKLEIIYPKKGESFSPYQHLVSGEEQDKTLFRGKIVRCEKPGYKNSTSVIQKAKIIISK